MWKGLCESASSLGFDKVIYLYAPDNSFSNEQASQRTTYADDWMIYWNEQGYADIDIGVRKTIEMGYAPLCFTSQAYIDNHAEEESEEALHALWEAKNEGGCHHIYSHQLFQSSLGKGAMGFVSSELSDEEFATTVSNHGALLSAMIHISHARLSSGMIEGTPEIALTGRQKDILVCFAKGLQYKRIGFELGINENTVAFHISELKRKLGCNTSREILGKAYRLQLLHSV